MGNNSGIMALLALGVLYTLKNGKPKLKINGNGFNGFTDFDDDVVTDSQIPLNIPLIRRDPTRTYTYVSKKTGLISPGMFTRPKHMAPLLSKRADIWIE